MRRDVRCCVTTLNLTGEHVADRSKKAYFNFINHIILYTILTSTKFWIWQYNSRKYPTYANSWNLVKPTSKWHVPLSPKYTQYCEKRRYFEDARVKFCQSFYNWAASSEFVSSSIPSWQILTAHAQPFRGARDLGFCMKVPLDSLLVWARAEVLARLRGCAGSPEPSLLA